jgi:hypothetical protein
LRESETIGRHRIGFVAAALLLVGWAAASLLPPSALGAQGAPDRIVFPVVGKVSFEDDFGAPRGNGTHQGNDILADRKAPAVAAEAGKIKFWTHSATAGCMLYLYGKSGATYLYIHLNNDLGKGNDNKGSCKPGISYAPGLIDGQSVRAGQLLGYVGDSGDANGGATHLHFEIHPGDGPAVSPFPWLKKAIRPLFPVAQSDIERGAAAAATLTLIGTIVKLASPPGGESSTSAGGSGAGSAGSGGTPPPPPPPAVAAKLPAAIAGGSLLTIKLTLVRVSTGGSYAVSRNVTLTLPNDAVLQRVGGKAGAAADLAKGTKVTIATSPIELSLAYQLAKPGVLAAATITTAS